MNLEMDFFVLRHIATQRLMPARMHRSTARGWTHWEPTDPKSGFNHAPRLFTELRDANNAVTQWVKGPMTWQPYGDPLDGYIRLEAKKRDRRPEDLEVVPVTLLIPLTGSR